MATPISIVNGEYKKNTDAYTSVAGTVVNGDVVKVRRDSSAVNSTTTTATLTVGGYSTDFNITTKPATPTDTVTFIFEVVIYPDFIDARYQAMDSRGMSVRILQVSDVLGGLWFPSTVTRGGGVYSTSITIPADSYISRIESYLTANSITSAASKQSRIYRNGTLLGSSSTSFPAYITNAQFALNKDTALAENVLDGDIIRLEHGAAPVIGNDLQSQDFVSNCPEGFVGGTVTYTVPADTYTAATKEEANADALQDIEDNGQAYADSEEHRNCTEEEPLPSFTFNTPWSFTDTGAGSILATRTYDQTSFPSIPTPAFWSVSAGGYGLRVNWEDSANCPGGTNDKTQSATATVSINVTTAQAIQAIWEGLAEKQASTFEQMTIFIDGVEIGSATSPGGSLGCEMGPVVSTNLYPSGYPLTIGDHTITINASTNDPLYHVGSYYSFVFNRVDP
jgi:hypothetical protein